VHALLTWARLHRGHRTGNQPPGRSVNGLSNADISARLGISLDMVKEHNQKLFEKLGVTNRTEAVAITLKKHLLKT